MDLSTLRGAAFDIHLPVGEKLLNKAAGTFVQHPELDQLYLTCLEDNRMKINFTISPKITISKELQVYVQPDLGFPGFPRLHMTIESGLNFLDRIVISFIKNRLPDWVQLRSKELIVELAPVFERSGFGDYLTQIQSAKIQVAPHQLIIKATYKN